MNDRWLGWAMQLQSIAQIGLTYCQDPFDRERYEQLRAIAAEMMAQRTGMPTAAVREVFCNESGYQTPKIDTRAAIFREGRLLLVQEKNGTWSLPGGWCDVDQSVASNTVKEVREETGLAVTPERLIAVQDWRNHNVQNYAYGVIKLFVLCRAQGGCFKENSETAGFDYFDRDRLPEPLAAEKTTREQLQMCFDAADDPQWQTILE